jgi:hypothetical protein
MWPHLQQQNAHHMNHPATRNIDGVVLYAIKDIFSKTKTHLGRLPEDQFGQNAARHAAGGMGWSDFRCSWETMRPMMVFTEA